MTRCEYGQRFLGFATHLLTIVAPTGARTVSRVIFAPRLVVAPTIRTRGGGLSCGSGDGSGYSSCAEAVPATSDKIISATANDIPFMRAEPSLSPMADGLLSTMLSLAIFLRADTPESYSSMWHGRAGSRLTVTSLGRL
jgi:hypothetical protein